MKKLIAGLIQVTLLVVAGMTLAGQAWSQDADTILVNGKILTVDTQFSSREAVAVRDGKIVALGTTVDVRKLAGPKTRVIDLQGRTVIPGLIDNHMHAIRAAQTFSTEVNWIGAKSLADGLARIHDAAQRMKPGSWLIVVTPPATLETFKEKRQPTQAELLAVAPNNPVYVQLGYGSAIMTPPGACGAEYRQRRRPAGRVRNSKKMPMGIRPAWSPATWWSCSTGFPSPPSMSRSRAPKSSSANSIAWA